MLPSNSATAIALRPSSATSPFLEALGVERLYIPEVPGEGRTGPVDGGGDELADEGVVEVQRREGIALLVLAGGGEAHQIVEGDGDVVELLALAVHISGEALRLLMAVLADRDGRPGRGRARRDRRQDKRQHAHHQGAAQSNVHVPH